MFSNLLLRRIKIVSNLDCITFYNLSTYFRNVRVEDSFLLSTVDGLQLAGGIAGRGGEIQLWRTTIACVTTATNAKAKCIICQPGNNAAKYLVTCVDSIFISDTTATTTQSQAISVDGSQNEFDFVGGSVRSAGNNPLDFLLANSPIVRVSNTFIFDTNKVSGGTILYAPQQCL